MFSEESFRGKERQYERFGVCSSTIKSWVNRSLEDIINGGIDDCQKKLKSSYPEKKLVPALEKLREVCITSAREHRSQIDNEVDKLFESCPTTMDVQDDSCPNEEDLNQEIKDLRLKLYSLNAYKSELRNSGNELEQEGSHSIDQYNKLDQQFDKIKATSQQRSDEIEMVYELFSSYQDDNTALENSVMNMSIN